MSSSSQSDTPPDTPAAGDGTSSGIRGLADTAQTLGSSVQAMQQALLGNLQQAALMTSSMNQMMEELVRRAIHTTVEAESAARGCALHVKVLNRSPVPLTSLTLRLRFAPRRALSETLGVRLRGPGDGGLFAGVEQDGLLGPEADGVLVECAVPAGLASGAACAGEVHVEIERPVQLSGRVSVGFASPGTGQLLAVENRFGIHLAQLMRCAYAADGGALPEALEGADMLDLDLAAARSVFAVPPAQGVAAGAVLSAEFGRDRLLLRVVSVSDDLRSARCQWLRPDDKLLPLIAVLSEELAIES
ncbi:hypothetical protein LPJ53_001573 [Coemansia erecta]|uniref:Uncharacterized protein n=1 Tax=Coemansia erecta TaxID=147472 RepID=A0A9W7XZQ8_9FUNG|nr:hypothetical protein LPJ53_001573 [Coemansia erecta]